MKYSRKVLDNGLRVITVAMPSFESATVLLMVGAGSRYENSENSGISHFLEHMAFKGTEKRPSAIEISSIIDGMGGEWNAFTGKEYTGFYIKSAKTRIETSYDILSDMLINSKLDPVEIEKEKGVIIEEINLYEDMPARKINDVYEALLYGDTPMGWDISGNKEVIKAVKREDFVNYMDKFYSADNMSLVVAGGVAESEVLTLAEKYFAGMRRFESGKYTPVAERQDRPQLLIKQKQTEQIHVAIGVRTVALADKRRYPLSLLASILGGGMSSRLFHEVREKRGLCYYIRSSSDEYMDAGSLVTTSGVDPKRVDEAIKVIVEEYGRVASGNMSLAEAELRKAKEYMKGHLVLELEDSRSAAVYYAMQELLEDQIDNPDEVIAKIEAVTIDEVEQAGKDFFKNSGLNLAVIGKFDDGQRLEDLLKL